MKRKTLYITLAVTAALCILFWVSKSSFAGVFTSVLAFPFEQIAMGLRELSLAGGVWNALALMLYAAVSLVPVWFLLRISSKRKLHREDWLLALLSALLFFVLYQVINPGSMTKLFGDGTGRFQDIHKAILGSVVWSVLIGYLILNVLRKCFESSTKKLQGYLSAFLYALAVLFVVAALGVALGETINSFAVLNEANAGTESTLGMSYAFIVLRFLVNIAPFILNIVTIVLGLNLLDNMKADRFSDETALSAEKLSVWCKKTLSIVVLANIAFNVLQLLFAGSIRNLDSNISIPVVSICFVIVVLIFSRMIAEGRKLKEDNELII